MRSTNYFKFFLSGNYQVEFLRPAPGNTILAGTAMRQANTDDTDTINLRWRITGATQRAYRVVGYALYYPNYQPDTSVIVYDSGWVYTSVQSHTLQYSDVNYVKTGSLPYGEVHFWQIQTQDSLGQTGESEMLSIVPSGTAHIMQNGGASYNTAPTVTPIDGCTGDPTALPGLKVTWPNITLGTNETFVRWEVWRAKPYRLGYTREWVKLAEITDYATRTYRDYEVAARGVYEYFVKAVADYGTTRRVSNILPNINPTDQFPKVGAGSVAFDYVFVHSKTDPTKYVRFDAGAVAIDTEQEQSTIQTWGRLAPSMYVGTAEFRRVRINGFTERAKQARTREAILTLLSLQRTAAAMLVVRHGQSGEFLYAGLAGPSSNYDLKATASSINLVELHNLPGSVA